MVPAARHLIETRGIVTEIKGAPGKIVAAEIGELKVLFTTMDDVNRLLHGRYLIDVWYRGPKVLSVYWSSNEIRDYHLVSMRRGPWVGTLLELVRLEAT